MGEASRRRGHSDSATLLANVPPAEIRAAQDDATDLANAVVAALQTGVDTWRHKGMDMPQALLRVRLAMPYVFAYGMAAYVLGKGETPAYLGANWLALQGEVSKAFQEAMAKGGQATQ